MGCLIRNVNHLNTTFTSLSKLSVESDAWIIFVVGLIYLLGVQGITVSIHLPLNNHIQKIDINDMNNQSLNEERTNFEMRWNYFNKIRTFIAFAASLSFLLILMVR